MIYKCLLSEEADRPLESCIVQWVQHENLGLSLHCYLDFICSLLNLSLHGCIFSWQKRASSSWSLFASPHLFPFKSFFFTATSPVVSHHHCGGLTPVWSLSWPGGPQTMIGFRNTHTGKREGFSPGMSNFAGWDEWSCLYLSQWWWWYRYRHLNVLNITLTPP